MAHANQPETPPAEADKTQEKIQDRMSAFVAKLSDEANRRVGKRLEIEQRWIEDLQQYHGVYDNVTFERLKSAKGSRVFVNLTATKSDALEARLWDLLFPTDDRNWGLSPTPVPDLTEQAEAALSRVDDARERGDLASTEAGQQVEAGNTPGARQTEERMRTAEVEENEAQAAADDLQEVLEEAHRRSDLMQEEIHDQFVSCKFPAEARDAISDACKLGIGIIKGPVLGGEGKQRFVPQQNAESPEYALESVDDNSPCAYRVDPWSFFPDPDQRRIADGAGVYERHLMNKTRLRKLAKVDGMDKDAIRDILEIAPDGGSTPAYMSELHDLTGQTDGDIRDVYQVWEFTGPIDSDDMEMLLAATTSDKGKDEPKLDPLTEFHVRVWFSQGRLFSFALHPLDSNESLYSTFTIRADETTVFGFGIPWIMRHPQSILNGATRMMMDNSGLSTGPQIVINKDQVTPEDGNWNLSPRKIWLRNSGVSQAGEKPFETFNIPSNQVELENIIKFAKETIDQVVAMPALAQGEQGVGVTKTKGGMALLLNSANVSYRRIVKNYDDDITTPIVRRFYHWNMQFSDKPEIKGDYDVQAHGSSVLLVREMQAQNLMMIADRFSDHPIYGPMLKHGDLLRLIFRAHMIAADEVTKTDREYKQFMAEQADNPSPAEQAAAAQTEIAKQELQLRRDEMDAKTALAEMERDYKLKIAQMEKDKALESAAAGLNIRSEELDAKIGAQNIDGERKERALAAEIAMAERTGRSSGGSV